MAEIQITNTETLSERKFPLKFYNYQKPDPEGKMQDLKAEIYFRPDAAAVLLYDTQQQTFMLTKQFRLPTFLNGNDTGYLTEACAGLIDEGETPEQTVEREVSEELGCKINNLTKISAVYTSAGGITEYVHLFTASYNANEQRNGGGGLPDEGEVIEAVELSFDDARIMLMEGQLNDAKSVILLQYYFLFC